MYIYIYIYVYVCVCVCVCVFFFVCVRSGMNETVPMQTVPLHVSYRKEAALSSP